MDFYVTHNYAAYKRGGGSANKSAAVKTNKADRAAVVNLNKFNKIN